MKSPTSSEYVCGNVFVVIALFIALLYNGYTALFAGGETWPPILLLFVVSYCGKCYQTLADYKAWQTEWEAMDGAPSAAAGGKAVWQVIVAAIIVNAMMYFTKQGWDDGTMPWLYLGWIGLNILFAGMFVLRLMKKIKRRAPSKPKPREVIVSVCVPMPNQSPASESTYQLIPEYCRSIMRY